MLDRWIGSVRPRPPLAPPAAAPHPHLVLERGVVQRAFRVLHVHVGDGGALQQRGGVQPDVVRGRGEEARENLLDVLQRAAVDVALEARLHVVFHCANVHLEMSIII